jgi:DNA-binding transcriptional ArsR family regulator
MPAAILLDQRQSRGGQDLVEPWLRDMGDPSLTFLLAFERTAGDEMEALIGDPATLTEVVLRALRTSAWWIGVGIGSVARPLPQSVRQSQGPAFVLARRAIQEAKARPERIRVLAEDRDAGDLEAALLLMGVLFSRRHLPDSPVSQMRKSGLTIVQIADQLGVSKQAVSQQLRVARTEEEAGRRLVEHLAQAALR